MPTRGRYSGRTGRAAGIQSGSKRAKVQVAPTGAIHTAGVSGPERTPRLMGKGQGFKSPARRAQVVSRATKKAWSRVDGQGGITHPCGLRPGVFDLTTDGRTKLYFPQQRPSWRRPIMHHPHVESSRNSVQTISLQSLPGTETKPAGDASPPAGDQTIDSRADRLSSGLRIDQ